MAAVFSARITRRQLYFRVTPAADLKLPLPLGALILKRTPLLKDAIAPSHQVLEGNAHDRAVA